MRKYMQIHTHTHIHILTIIAKQIPNDQVQKECKRGRMRIIKDFECRTNYSCGRISNCTFRE